MKVLFAWKVIPELQSYFQEHLHDAVEPVFPDSRDPEILHPLAADVEIIDYH